MGLSAFAEARRTGAQVYEDLEDIVAEVKEDLNGDAEG